MKELIAKKRGPLDLGQLADELLAAFPGWRQPSPFGGYETDLRVTAVAGGACLILPDEADEAAVITLVEAHTPQERTPAPTTDGVIAALAAMQLEGVTTISGLKAAIAPIRDAAAAVVTAESAIGRTPDEEGSVGGGVST